MISTIICGLTEVLVPGLRVSAVPQLAPGRTAGEVIIERLVVDDLHGLYKGEMSEPEFCRKMLDRAGWPVDIDDLRATIRQRFLQPVPGTAEILRALAGRYRLVLLADHARSWIDEIRRTHAELLRLFDRSFFSFDLHRTKHDPVTFRMVLGLLGDPPSECLVIDADPPSIAAAKEAGLAAILFQDARQLAKELAERGIETSHAE
jgi:HAD superfamily hydrolase (TIGR01509 family)